MPYLKFNLLLLFLCTQVLLAKEEDILSPNRLKVFKYEEKQNIEDSNKLKKDWINPIIYTYSQNYGEVYDTSRSAISISQPIFKSGGIYAAISYANSLKKYSHLKINLQKKEMIKDATILLFQINKANLSIKRRELLLKNASIDVERKKEQVLNGFLDTSFLDNAILLANLNKNLLAELKYSKLEFINSFSNLASADYDNFTLPTLKLINKDEYLNNNINIQQSTYNVKNLYELKNITIAKYLPSISATYDYTKYHDIDNNKALSKSETGNYGLKIEVPFNVGSLNDIESAKLLYLKSKVNKENLILEQKNFFKSKEAKIKMIEEKMGIAKSDYILYNSLLRIIREEQSAGLKTKSDVDTLKNSQEVKSVELKILDYEKQIELLELYAHIN